jgi:EAL domain-containing protein (putative c-di-GMP-specific phosphodiesterase class I)/GGDEF domain-containing protein
MTSSPAQRSRSSGLPESADFAHAGQAPARSVSARAGHVRGAFDTLRDHWRLAGTPTDKMQFVGIAEIARFTTLRRSIGLDLSNQILHLVGGKITDALDACQIGRTGRTTIEFAFSASDPEAALVRLELLSDLLEERITIDGFTIDLPISIGFADAGTSTLLEELIDHAAAALAEAQTQHQRVRYADISLSVDKSFDDLALMRDLPRAIRAGELRLHYQPKLRSKTNTVDSAEALLRWWHPDRGQIATDRLIELAESTGIIRDLSEWVLERAVEDQLRLAKAGHDLTIYVNVSGVLLPDAGFAALALDLASRAPGRIGFEITETAVIKDPEGALTNLNAFAAAGIKIAIDDYGSGLSSLAYLKQLPANELKIDRMFISGLTQSHQDPLLVRSSIDLAHALNMEVTAEGVDDAMALALLRVMGCDLIQGYLISRPIDIEALVHFLEEATSGLKHCAPLQFGMPSSGSY